MFGSIASAFLLMLALPAVAEEAGVGSEMGTESGLESGSDLGSGMASYFSREMAGRRTANGEICNPDTLTAAHRTVAFGRKIRVTNLANGDSVVVRVNDRGPFTRSRVIDISHAAAREIGMHRGGTARVKLTLLES